MVASARKNVWVITDQDDVIGVATTMAKIDELIIFACNTLENIHGGPPVNTAREKDEETGSITVDAVFKIKTAFGDRLVLERLRVSARTLE
jgi:hypothetical protein